jgi:antitoxin component YwqK of YwqJK toxin-antitoxin module
LTLNQVKSKVYKRYFPSGQVKEIANYQQGVLDGNRKFYYESGDVEQDQNYLDGLFQGASFLLYQW